MGKGPYDYPLHQKYQFVTKGWISRKIVEIIKQSFQWMLVLYIRFEKRRRKIQLPESMIGSIVSVGFFSPLLYIMTQFKISCQITLDSLKYSVAYVKTSLHTAGRKWEEHLCQSSLQTLYFLSHIFFPSLSHPPPFSLPIAGKNCINNKKATELSFMHHSEIVLMQIGLSCFCFSFVTIFSNKPDKSNRSWKASV